ncbi:MAG: extracellular solute-binding protein [Microcoleaceae cyanobacterium]
MKRREILRGASVLALGSILTGCGRSIALKVELLKGSVPVQALSQFRRSHGQPVVDFVPEVDLEDLYAILRASGSGNASMSASRDGWLSRLNPFRNRPQENSAADLILIGDYWLTQAIQQKLVQSLEPETLQNWDQLPSQWQRLVRRNENGELDQNGSVWAAPYRWGSTVIIYRADQFKRLGWEPQDWSDLWREELRDRISLLDQPREVIGAVLKKLGHSYNTPDLQQVSDLESEFRQLHQKVKLYDSTGYLRPLILGDTWATMGWSTDIPLQVQRQYDLKVVIPKSGTCLWSDLWVRPSAAPPFSTNELATQWIDFCWETDVATQLSLLTEVTSPVVMQMQPQDIPSSLRENSILYMDPQSKTFKDSEFLIPLDSTASQQYQSLWVKIRKETRD